jgi:hypothetical protein
MNSIEIYINNIGNDTNIYIYVKEHKMIINNQEKTITEEKIDELLRIIRTWDNVYENTNSKIDGENFIININTIDGTSIIKGNNNYPENYYLLKE